MQNIADLAENYQNNMDTHRALQKQSHLQAIQISKQSRDNDDNYLPSQNNLMNRNTNSQDKAVEQTGMMRFLSMKYYQQYFQVSENEVIQRITTAIIPPFNDQFLPNLNKNVDFYGPLWILTTLVLLLSFSGNFSNYILSKFYQNTNVIPQYFFKLNLSSKAFTLVFSFGLGVPLALHFYIKYLQERYIMLQSLICLYGYSLSTNILVFVVCSFVPINLVQNLCIFYGYTVSTVILVLNSVRDIENSKSKTSLMIGIIIMQTIFFLCFKPIFFQQLQITPL